MNDKKSKIWFKILNRDGSSIDPSGEKWSLPYRISNGQDMFFAGKAWHRTPENHKWNSLKGIYGTWLVNDPTLLYQLNDSKRIFTAQFSDLPQMECPGWIWVQKVCLIREATQLDLKTFGIHKAISPQHFE